MIVYQFGCPDHGPFDVRLPLGSAPARHPCPDCGLGAVRRWSTTPLVGDARARRTAVLDHCERSRTEPEVVHRLPGRPAHGRRPAPSPATAHLPRP
ncbi:zinc ribbon domain-containing protein [Pseudonocardia spirodelae]|uniref:Zinc ribbon domain-containing protein n=1 Tax=Pseudonocardia spirodelae TaxID=3133431 RepID=A0ABU8T2J8_9PSEU